MDDTSKPLARVDTIYAVITADEFSEGIVAAPIVDGMMSLPLVAPDEKRVRDIVAIARMIGQRTGMIMRLVKFTKREDIEVI